MNDYLLYLFIGIVGAWTGKEYFRREQEKKKSECPITKFTTNLSDMLEMNMTIDDINKFTAKIHAQVEISNIGISYNGKMNFFKQEVRCTKKAK